MRQDLAKGLVMARSGIPMPLEMSLYQVFRQAPGFTLPDPHITFAQAPVLDALLNDRSVIRQEVAAMIRQFLPSEFVDQGLRNGLDQFDLNKVVVLFNESRNAFVHGAAQTG